MPTGCRRRRIRMAMEHLAVSIDHLEHATAADGKPSRRSHHRHPSAVSRLPRRGFAPARALIEAGVPVALAAIQSPPHTHVEHADRGCAGLPRMGLTPAEAICAATINGAHALGLRRSRWGRWKPENRPIC